MLRSKTFNQPTSPNRAYLASPALAGFAKIQPYGWTSDTLGTLCESRATLTSKVVSFSATRFREGMNNGKNRNN